MMIRIRVLMGLSLVLALLPTGGRSAARAQWGWGGWAGGTGTVQGDIARGLGNLAAGAGYYNQQTAVANSINADTAAQFNQYLWMVQQENNRRYYKRQARRIGRANETLAQTTDRLRNRPETADIERGNALNVLLDDLTAPGLLHSSGLRQADSTIEARLVREIPFRNAAEAVTVCLDQLLDKNKFPELLRSEALTSERESFIAAVDEAARQARGQGVTSAAAAQAVWTTGKALYEKAKSPQIAALPADRNEALNFLKAMAGLARVAQSPDIVQKLKDLDQLKATRVYNLIAFMQAHNLRFGPAETPAQRDAYRTLYPILKADRDKLYASLPAATAQVSPPPDPEAIVTETFKGVDDTLINQPPGR